MYKRSSVVGMGKSIWSNHTAQGHTVLQYETLVRSRTAGWSSWWRGSVPGEGRQPEYNKKKKKKKKKKQTASLERGGGRLMGNEFTKGARRWRLQRASEPHMQPSTTTGDRRLTTDYRLLRRHTRRALQRLVSTGGSSVSVTSCLQVTHSRPSRPSASACLEHPWRRERGQQVSPRGHSRMLRISSPQALLSAGGPRRTSPMTARFVVAQVCAAATMPPTVSGRGCSGTKRGESLEARSAQRSVLTPPTVLPTALPTTQA
ncbi:hypothetical protein P171DRAFT_180379 [Karstenula rhodostoma CBS 690.94]|uniref:Uncharacterized protein n=1 Tax=Karstenula rhodostoma CBS 690.94 TaxID=1392251 RepID=A0A9P4U5T2_9PLEO|nr:hypothetical protein P171DRAFT_180379 [Karstenula rhodostoma CBS 690.94]